MSDCKAVSGRYPECPVVSGVSNADCCPVVSGRYPECPIVSGSYPECPVCPMLYGVSSLKLDMSTHGHVRNMSGPVRNMSGPVRTCPESV